jgi:predicted  nucleic acid-binding Zn-ribbon protein
MSDTERTRDVKVQLEGLKQVRDEVRLELALASMELRERWQRLEPLLQDAERLAAEVGESSRRVVEELVPHFLEFRDRLRAWKRDRSRP